MEESKYCGRCHQRLPLTKFYKNKNSVDGHGTYCKSCQNAANRASQAQVRSRSRKLFDATVTAAMIHEFYANKSDFSQYMADREFYQLLIKERRAIEVYLEHRLVILSYLKRNNLY